MKLKQVLSESVNQSTASRVSTAVGEVIEYNEKTNRATIFIKKIAGNESYTFRNVPVQLSSYGLHSSPIEQGDIVYVQFNRGSIFQPKIVGIASEQHDTLTRPLERHLRKGTLLVSQEESDKELDVEYKTWIDNDNESNIKYYNFKNLNPVKTASLKMADMGYFKNKEVGLYNPNSSSIVKIQDDGVIDIFASTNVGVRVNPKNRTVELFGDISTKSKNWKVISNNVDVYAKNEVKITSNKIDIKANSILVNGEEVFDGI